VFTHMQQPGDKPLFPDSAAKYPLIILSGGYNTHGLWHLAHLKFLAAHGYIVVDMFHGDGRGTSFQGNLALRSLELRMTLDFVLQHPGFAPAIDSARIGAVGESAGGHTVLAALGGVDPAGRIPDGSDPRIKAAFGLVPFMGGSFGFWPFKVDAWFFGEDHAGLRGVQRPFFAVYGEKDTNVPPKDVEAGMREIAGPATAVMLDREKHLVSDASSNDIRTWELLFFDAWLRDDAAARQKLESGQSVRGGVNDHKTFEHGALSTKQ
jgi:predicted dienelactone hydrolase